MDSVKAQISSEVDALAQDMYDISDFLKANPETAYQEYKACDHLSGVLEEKGFRVQKGVGQVETSFLARPVNGQAGRPTVAILAEYDALPKIGHGCGHNLIAAASLGAAIALKKILKIDSGGLVVVGTPAEEGGGGKARLAQAGVFDDLDLAMMFHPGGLNIAGKDMLGRTKFQDRRTRVSMHWMPWWLPIPASTPSGSICGPTAASTALLPMAVMHPISSRIMPRVYFMCGPAADLIGTRFLSGLPIVLKGPPWPWAPSARSRSIPPSWIP
jgi:hypothetical protein